MVLVIQGGDEWDDLQPLGEISQTIIGPNIEIGCRNPAENGLEEGGGSSVKWSNVTGVPGRDVK